MIVSTKWWQTLPSPDGLLKSEQSLGRECLLKNNGLPVISEESWRLFDISQIQKLLDVPLINHVEQKQLDVEDRFPELPNKGLRLVLGRNDSSIEQHDLPAGIRGLTREEVEEKLGCALSRCSSSGNWPVVINQASASEILALCFEGTDLPPVELIIQGDPGYFSSTRVVLFLEKNVKLDLLQIFNGSKESVLSNLFEIHLAEGSKLNHGCIGLGNDDASLMCHLAVMQEQGSHYSLSSVQEGWSFSRFEPSVVQVHGRASTTLRGLQASCGNQKAFTNSSMRFDGPEGSLDQLHKSIASHSSHNIFHGAIDVPRVAQKTNASQLSRNMLLSSRARVDTKPQLEIVADNVRCSHGATISQIQEEELFYLLSRGIGSDQSMQLLLKGYCQEILDSLPLNAQRWNVLEKLLCSLMK